MTIKIIKEKISKEELKNVMEKGFGSMVKVSVDVEKEILAIGGDWHAESQDLLVKQEKSDGQSVWGINFYPRGAAEKRIEYTALINIKPSLSHRDMTIRDKLIRDKIKNIINKLLLEDNETLTS